MSKNRKAKHKTNLKRQIKDGKKSITEVMTTSAVGTQVYEIQDPSERLIAIIGASMFNEPKYYPVDPQSQKREYEYDTSDFDEQAQLIINTAQQIAESDNPRDLLAIAHWARKEMKIRTTPQVLLSVAAHCPETKKHVREYCKKVILRADELKQVFIASRALYGSTKSLPNSLKRGLADAFSRFKERDFLKYEGQHRPYFSDILKMVDRAKDWPLNKALDHYLKTGEVQDPKAIPVIAARKILSKLKSFGPEAEKYAKESGATWEVLLSQFGNTKDIWEHLIDTNALPYMATLRNLRNILQAKVSDNHIEKVCKKLIDGAIKSKQLPHRFLAARGAIIGDTGGMYLHYRVRFNPSSLDKQTRQVYDALGKAVDQVIEALDDIPGKSLIAVDNSGSMNASISTNSAITMNQAASLLGAIITKCSEQGSVLGGFGESWATVKPMKDVTALDLADAVASLNVGHSTNAEKVLQWALKQQPTFDRVIIISDMQTYGGAGGYSLYHGRGIESYKSVSELIKEYREKKNKDCKLHCIDLAGHGNSLTEQADTNTNIVAGYSEKLLDTILEFEGLKTETVINEKTGEKKEKQVFTIEYVRENF